MRLLSLRVENLRNIQSAECIPDPELTVIAGENGQGKTNLLECIWLLTGSKSFRGSKDMEIVRRECAFGRIVGESETNDRDSKIEILVHGNGEKKRGRYAKVNAVEYGRASSVAGIFTAVVFDPNHLSLIKGGPDGRRRFLDAALCQLYPGYLSILRRFYRAVTQKNALLKRAYSARDANEMLDAFDIEIVHSGEEITRRRTKYLEAAGPAAQGYYAEISNNAEAMQLQFKPCAQPGGLAELLAAARQTDIRVGFSTTGPQREDFEVLLDGQSARMYGSQGQQRSIVLSLKLAEAAHVLEITGEHPVMLLDDVLSELDAGRQAYLLSRMQGKQSFVTACDEAAFARTGGKILRVEHGSILE